jgi:hypothetical protein
MTEAFKSLLKADAETARSVNPTVLNETARDPGLLGSEQLDIGKRVYSNGPGFVRISAFAHEDCLHFGQVHRTGCLRGSAVLV